MKTSRFIKPLLFSLRSLSAAGFFLLLLTPFSCSDPNSCFDKELYNEHRDDICTMDCPGVRGCDGRIYCNECVANRQGIRVGDQ